MSQNKVTVRILDREYQFAASGNERPELLAASDNLDSTMRAIKGKNSSLGAEKIAIMAALNMSHELMQLKQAQEKISNLQKSLHNSILAKQD